MELNEKVRAIRAKRSASTSPAEAPVEDSVKPFDVDPRSSVSSAKRPESRLSYGRDVSSRVATTQPESEPQPEPAGTPARRTSSNIVEAALTRVKRASENASRAALPKIEPSRSIQASAQVSLARDREATARALAHAPEIELKIEVTPRSPEVAQPRIAKSANVEASRPYEQQPAEEENPAPSPVSQAALVDEVEPPSIAIIDELEPLDYLEAEIRKVDQTLGAQFLRNESPSIFTHAIIGIADLLVLSVTSGPFLAIIRIVDGSFSNTRTRLASAGIVALLSFFYLALTQSLCGRTFGMMLTNTRIVDVRNFETLSPSRALLRTAGYLIAVAPAMLGIVWALFNRKHRGWQDFLAGTIVVRDF